MFAFIAAVLFALALILHLLGTGPHGIVLTFTLGGLLAVALHLALGTGLPWRHAA